jgi:CelD/BcsL family acetyltransferase involved in cellulose biosynthesis
MKTAIISDWQQLSSLESEWNPLLKLSRADCLFLTWEWIQAWRSVVGEERQLLIVTVRNSDDKLIGVAPFYHYHLTLFDRVRFKALRILGDYSTGFEYPDWFVHPDCENEALSAITETLLSARNLWDVIWMPRISGWSGAAERICGAVQDSGLLYHRRTTDFSYLPLPNSIKDFEDGFSANRRQQLRRNRRKLTSKQGVDITFCRNQDQLSEYMEALFDLHHRRWMLLDDPGCFIRRPAEAAFYKAFLPKALDNGWLRFAALRQDDRIEAIQIGYAYNHDFLQLQEGFNPDYVQGAGNVLRHVIIDECIAEGLKNYDFLGGLSEHKRRWGAVQRDGFDILIAHPSLKNRLLFLKEIWPSGRFITEHELVDGNN